MDFGREANPLFWHGFGLISLLLAHHWWAKWIMRYLISLCLFVLKSTCNNVQNSSNNSWFCKPWLEFVPRVTLRSFYVVYILQHIVWEDQCVFSVCNILLIRNYFCLVGEFDLFATASDQRWTSSTPLQVIDVFKAEVCYENLSWV